MKINLRLYKNSLAKLLIPASIIGIITVLSSVLYLGGRIKEINFNGYGMFFRGQPTAFAIAPSLSLFMFLGPIVFTYLTYSYLNKRNASDFYHSLPYTRIESFLSKISAILSYQILIIALTLFASFITLMVSNISFNATFFPLLFLGYTACCVLVTGVVLLAMSITGNLLSNVLIGGLILFLPRMILFIVDQFIMNVTFRRVVIGQTGIFLNPVYNIATASLLDISRLWEYYGLSETLINPGSIIYTLILGLIYIVISAYLIINRKSELAGRGAISAKMACVYSCLASLPFLILGVYTTNGRNLMNLSYTSYMYMLIIIAVAFAIFIIIGFILNSKWKPALKAIPFFAVTLVFAIGIVISSTLIAQNMAMQLPDRDKIEYVKINENGEVDYRYRPVYSYNSLLASKVEFYEEDVIDLLHQTLRTNNEVWEEHSNEIYNNNYSVYSNVFCEFKMKSGKSIFRRVDLYMKDIADLYDACIENEQYLEAYTSLPDDGVVKTYEYNLQEKTIDKVYDVYEKEFGSMSIRQKSVVNFSYMYNSIFFYKMRNLHDHRYVSTMFVTGYYEENPYVKEIMISKDTPKTADFYLKEMNRYCEDKYLPDLQSILSDNLDYNINLHMQILNDNQQYKSFMYSSEMSEEEMEFIPEVLTGEEIKELTSIIKKYNLNDVSIEKQHITINIDKYGMYEDQNEHYVCYVPLSKGDMEYLVKMYDDKIAKFENFENFENEEVYG